MKEKVNSIIDILKARYPDALCALHYSKDYELMIAVRLSAQCTDARVNMITPALFEAYPTLEAMAAADITDVENYVRSCGFYKHKARDIVLGCQMLLTDYNGKVPGTMEDLCGFPALAEKPPISCWVIFMPFPEAWSATPTASASADGWV